MKESYASSNPGRVAIFYFLVKLGCIFLLITIGPFSVYSFFFFIIVYIFIISQISIQQIHKPSVSLAILVSELQSESDVRSNIIGVLLSISVSTGCAGIIGCRFQPSFYMIRYVSQHQII